MPYVFKDPKAPERWEEFRRKSPHPLMTPLLWTDWLCAHIAFYLGRWSFLELLEYAGSFSVLVAVVLYFAETGERRQQKHYQAWQVINTAQGKGGSGGRLDALRQLNDDHVPLVGVDVAGAFLQNVQLDGAGLRRARFSAADLRNAHFRHAELGDADFTSANLREADLRDADLLGANLTDADLTGADFSLAHVSGATFDKADLRRANLAGLVDWKQIQSVRLANVEGVRNPPDGFIQWAVERGAVQIASTEQWNEAIRRAEPAGK